MNRWSVKREALRSGDRHRLALDRRRRRVRGHEHVHRPALDRKHQHGAAEQDQRERGHECDERHRLGQERAGDGREDLAQAALQEISQIRAQQHRDQYRRSDNRHRQQDLKGGLGDELNGNRLPVRRGEQRTALQQMLQVQAISL
jgi:hypothetical protein